MNEPENTAGEAAAQAAVAVELDALRRRLVRVRSDVDAGDAGRRRWTRPPTSPGKPLNWRSRRA